MYGLSPLATAAIEHPAYALMVIGALWLMVVIGQVIDTKKGRF